MTTMHLHQAGRWLLHSGIQSPSGGVARYYLGQDERYLPVSTEITGYAASTYVWLYERTGDHAYREAAVRTARFLAGEAWDDAQQTFPFETAPGSPAYFFDCGIIVRGLLAVSRIEPDAELMRVATACAHGMARDFLDGATIHPIVELPGKAPRTHEKRWSREPGCFLLKAAMPWRQLSDDAILAEHWHTALRASIANHEAFLPGELVEEKVMDRLHAYCYFLEALLAEPHDAEAAAALRRGIARVGGYLRAIRARFLRSDVCAQLLRVRLYADWLGVEPLDERAAEHEADLARSFSLASEDVRLDGAFSFGARSGGILPIANPVSTGFCAQALDMWRAHRNGTPLQPVLDALI
ncbi:MAG: hypothetical protein R2762_03560 [Bryobacteraceae bacterium]